MPKKRVTIELDSEIITKLEKRAKKNVLSLREQIEDIVRRSAISSRISSSSGKCDDTLVEIFSRKTKKKKIKKRKRWIQ